MSVLSTIGDALLSSNLLELYKILQSMDDDRSQALISTLSQQMNLNLADPQIISTLTSDQSEQLHRFLASYLATLVGSDQNDFPELQNTLSARKLYADSSRGYTSEIIRNVLAMFQPILSLLLLAFACAYMWKLTFSPVDTINGKYGDTGLGLIIGTLFGTIINFYFGSSLPLDKSTRNRSLIRLPKTPRSPR